jgi:quercetin dioxygenase-like cupin family protein
MSNELEKGKVFIYTDSIAYSENAVVSKQVLKKETGNISLFAFDQGEGLSEHTAPFDAVVSIIDGKADVRIGGESRMLGTGDNIIMPADIPHAIHAVEKFKMVLTMIKSR